jgi:hypothetical protein
MNNKYIFQNVNIDKVNFVNNKNDIKFEFIDSYANSGKYCGELLCLDFISLYIHTDLDDDQFFPQFVCDVFVEYCPDRNNQYSIKFHGSTYDISILCKNIEIAFA